MVADETPPEIRGRAFGLRQALDTVGALLAPLVAIGLMALARERHPRGLLDRGHPGRAARSCSPGWRCASPSSISRRSRRRPSSPASGSSTRRPSACSQVGFLFALARFSEGFLILKGIDIGLSEAMSPLTLAIFNLAYVALAYPAGALSDRMSPRIDPDGGHGRADRRQSRACARPTASPGWCSASALWGAHMALTQGIFSRMIADSAPEELRATSFGAFWFVSGIGGLLASLGAGWLWDREGASATFLTSAGVAAVALAMLSLLRRK